MHIMKIRFYFLVFLLGCTHNIGKENVGVQLKEIYDKNANKISQYVYGINIDSMSIKTEKINWGQSFSNILSRYGVSNNIIFEATKKSKPLFNLKKLKKGKEYTLLFNHNSKKPSYFIYEPNDYTYLVYHLDDSVVIRKEDKSISLIEKVAVGTIESSLYETIEKNSLPIDLVYLLIDVFAWQVDFYRIQKGDKFKVVYLEEKINEKTIGIKEIKAAYFYHNDMDHYAFKYDQGQGIDYFDENGNNLRKTFLRSPLNYSRISSRYTRKRYHTILKRYRSHLGTDYVAPKGTPIRSVADGIVIEAKKNRANGIYIKIKHNDKYSTQYLHMSKFAKNIKIGKKIVQGQTIGYVGSTGLATGPHVCFRFWKNGTQVDPYKQNDLPPGEPISKQHINSFMYLKYKYLNQIEKVII